MKENPPKPVPAAPRRRFRWLRRDGIDLGDSVVQIIAVVIGILLALFINDQVTQHQQQTMVDEAMRAIRMELVSNRNALREDDKALGKTVAGMLTSPKNRGQSPRPCYMWHGFAFNSTPVTDAAYQTAIATQALAHMPFEQAHKVAKIYGVQQIRQRGIDVVANKILIAGPMTLDMCVGALISVANTDHQVASRYSPLIGADKVKWPTLPPNPMRNTHPPK